MIRILTLFGFLLTAVIVQAEETNNTVELKTLMSVSEKRHAALVLYVITGTDSTPDMDKKRENYYEALKQIAQSLRDQYYWHDEYPTNVFAGIEGRADILAAAKYPLSYSTGCSYFDYLRGSYRIQMAEETIRFMAKTIFLRFKDGDVKATEKPSPTFADWVKQWNLAGKVKDGPNQGLASMDDK